MLGSSSLGDGEAAVAPTSSSPIMGDIDDKSGGEFFESGGNSGGAGNRWPRQETIALLQIRSDMDVAFRDSSLKGPLWEEVSRKMAELGYHRSGKKCKEKFENVYKYHKRTKDGRVGKSEGKTYRFFDQLKALEEHHSTPSTTLPPPQGPPQAVVPVTMVMPVHGSTVPSSPQPISVVHVTPPPPPRPPVNHHTPPPPKQQNQQQNVNLVQSQQPRPQQQATAGHPISFQMDHSGPSSETPSSSSSTSSEEEEVTAAAGRRKRKRKWKDFFEKLMKDVIEKQEYMQKKFLEAVEKRENDRAVREEAWKMQEVARLNREHEILLHERSMAAAKDSALISFLQKLSEQQNNIPSQLPVQVLHSQPPPPQQVVKNPAPVAPPPLAPPPVAPLPAQHITVAHHKTNNGNGGSEIGTQLPASGSRWPKAEVEALINLRTNMDQKYEENGPKGPLWEEISAAMKRIGYNRNAKRCKEKWENINKYFKKVKESNRKRPEDSKTCPYFQQLDALYRQKNNKGENTNTNANVSNLNLGPAQQQWPDPVDPDPEDSDEDDEDGDEDDEANGYEIVANNANANANTGSTTAATTTATTTATIAE